eukprot:TRINITY_DN11476_c0_g3_i1.p1 TRINITY_DN11476_c0_g3~~TRINITY_DN11476_c0_g3_i1.p1  ORF type:complete len:593 (-),score=137.57 TRINITY_DN11476_c0_g3_i1:120-1898(-)
MRRSTGLVRIFAGGNRWLGRRQALQRWFSGWSVCSRRTQGIRSITTNRNRLRSGFLQEKQNYMYIAAPSRKRFYCAEAAQTEKDSLLAKKKSAELLRESEAMVEREDWIKAEDTLTLLLQHTSMHGTLEESKQLGRAVCLLAFVEQNRGKNICLRHFNEGIPVLKAELGEQHQDVGFALLNYAEALAMMGGNIEQAETTAREAVGIITEIYGEKRADYLGVALGNLGSYLATQKKYEEAREPLFKALDLLHKSFGFDNEYTKNSYDNCVRLLTELGNKEELEKFAQKWKDKDLIMKDYKIPEPFEEELKEFEQKLDETYKDESPGEYDPPGYFKDAEINKTQLGDFLKHFSKESEKLGMDLSDPAMVDFVHDELKNMHTKMTEKNLNPAEMSMRKRPKSRRKSEVRRDELSAEEKLKMRAAESNRVSSQLNDREELRNNFGEYVANEPDTGALAGDQLKSLFQEVMGPYEVTDEADEALQFSPEQAQEIFRSKLDDAKMDHFLKIMQRGIRGEHVRDVPQNYKEDLEEVRTDEGFPLYDTTAEAKGRASVRANLRDWQTRRQEAKKQFESREQNMITNRNLEEDELSEEFSK